MYGPKHMLYGPLFRPGPAMIFVKNNKNIN